MQARTCFSKLLFKQLLTYTWYRYLANSHSSLPPFAQRREPSQSAPRLLCSDPWPSCFRLRSVQTRSYRAWRSARMVPTAHCPWCQAPGPWALHEAHISHRLPHCSTHSRAPAADRTHPDKFQWGRCHALRTPPPRTWHRSGSRIALPGCAESHASWQPNPTQLAETKIDEAKHRQRGRKAAREERTNEAQRKRERENKNKKKREQDGAYIRRVYSLYIQSLYETYIRPAVEWNWKIPRRSYLGTLLYYLQ